MWPSAATDTVILVRCQHMMRLFLYDFGDMGRRGGANSEVLSNITKGLREPMYADQITNGSEKNVANVVAEPVVQSKEQALGDTQWNGQTTRRATAM